MIPRPVRDNMANTILENILQEFPLLRDYYPEGHIESAIDARGNNYYRHISIFIVFDTVTDTGNDSIPKMCYQGEIPQELVNRSNDRLNNVIELFYDQRKLAHQRIQATLKDRLAGEYGRDYEISEVKVNPIKMRIVVQPSHEVYDFRTGFIQVLTTITVQFHAIPIVTHPSSVGGIF